MTLPILTGALSQAAFDAIVRALAEPGTIRQLPPPPDPDVPAVAMPALALGDLDLGVSVDDNPSHPIAAMLRAATGMRVAAQSQADFVIRTDGTAPVRDMRIGTALAPEDGARLTVAVAELRTRGPGGVILTGPGVPGARTLVVDTDDGPMSLDTLLALGRASGPFPAGVDVWFVTPDGRIAAVPRSSTVAADHAGADTDANDPQRKGADSWDT